MKRRVEITTPLGDALKFHRLVGREALSQVHALDLDLLGNSNAIDARALLGKGATVSMQTETGRRYLGGIVTSFGLAQEDGRRSFYKMRLRPWLWLATRRSDFRVFQERTVPEIITAVLARYGYPMEQKLRHSYRAWNYCVQYGEDDCSFIARLCEHEGIHFHFRHEADRHVLVFADDIAGSHGPLPGGETVRYHPHEQSGMTGGPEPGERIHEWELVEEVRSGRHYRSHFDFEHPGADLSFMRRASPGHEHDDHELYEWPGNHVRHDDGETYARIRNEEQLSGRSRARGRSNLRELAPGHTMRLNGHPRADQNRQYLLLGVSYHLRENLESSEGAGHAEGSFQRFAFDALPTSCAWRPPRTTPKPRTDGPQTARVVGPPDEDIWTDRYGRVKVQFHWDRLGRHNENSSCWVRVSTSWAGAAFGAAALPRIGQEVIVDFLNGDPDHPIITGRVHNADEMPAWQLPGQAHLSGIRSREQGGGRSNHLALDDTNGKVQAQLRSDHQSSSLGLGHIARIEDTAGRKEDRGQGFELRTDGHGAIRASEGLLVTTEARANARAHMTDMGETVACLADGQALHERLSKAAKEAKAHEAGDQDTVAMELKAQHDEIRGSGGDPAQGVFPELQAPHLVLASPAGIQTAAEGSTHIVSDGHNALTSGAHTSVSAGKSFLVSARSAVRMVALSKGIRVVSAATDIDISALKHCINVLAKLNIKLEADRIAITAREEVLINGGSSFSRWNSSGIEHGTDGQRREHAAKHSFAGPGSLPVRTKPFPSVQDKPNWIELNHAYDDLEPVKGAPYTLTFDNGAVIHGMLGDEGFARHDGVPDGTPKVEWGEDARDWDGETRRPNAGFGAGRTERTGIDLVTRFLS